MENNKLRSARLSVLMASLLSGASVIADDGSATSGNAREGRLLSSIDEIVVTARKREESLQEVPMEGLNNPCFQPF